MLKTYNEIYLSARNALRQGGVEAYALEAKILVASAAGKTTGRLLRDLNLYTSEECALKTEEYVNRRLAGEPVAYITRSWEFYGLPMYVTSDVLIPRIDTEVLIDAAKDLLLGRKMNAKVLDLCCGSGCIACAVGHEFPATTVFAVDNSPSALQVCRKNIADNRMQNHIFTMQADALGFPPVSLNSFDLILCNPPYVPTEEIKTLDISVRNYEPLSALDGGEDGLKFYRAILKYWKSVLRPGGHIMFEVGENQAQKVWNLMEKEGFFNMYTRTDTLHVERVVVGKLGNEF